MGTFFQSAPSARKILWCTFSIWWCQSDPLSVFNATAEARLDYMPRKTLQQASVCSNRDNRGNLSQILLTLPSMCFARKWSWTSWDVPACMHWQAWWFYKEPALDQCSVLFTWLDVVSRHESAKVSTYPVTHTCHMKHFILQKKTLYFSRIVLILQGFWFLPLYTSIIFDGENIRNQYMLKAFMVFWRLCSTESCAFSACQAKPQEIYGLAPIPRWAQSRCPMCKWNGCQRNPTFASWPAKTSRMGMKSYGALFVYCSKPDQFQPRAGNQSTWRPSCAASKRYSYIY